MSDLSVPLDALERSRSQLSVNAYFDADLFRLEAQALFRNGPRYLGHELMVPDPGDYYTLPQEGEGRALVRTAAGVELISNVCRHRQALMLRGRGNVRGGGNGGPCLNLNNYPVQTWNGMVFEAGPRVVAADLARLGPAADLNFDGYVLDHVQMHECNYNWKTFIEVYLEDYHVGPFHPGLGQFVTCDELRWEFGEHHSVQTVGTKNELARPGTPAYRRWHDAVLKYRQGRFDNPLPKHGAIWLTYYPCVMVEWYPHVLVVSTLHPKGPQKTLNVVEFYYPEEISAFEREFIDAEQAAYWETCAEDDEIALRMDAGRHALMERGDDETGPYQSPMEDGMQQFHEWYRKAMARPA